MRVVPPLLLALVLLNLGPASGAVFGHDDGGSGRDAPDGTTGAVPVDADARHTGRFLSPGDHVDVYALDLPADAPVTLELRVRGPLCVRILSENGVEVEPLCPGTPLEHTLTYPLPAAKERFLELARLGAGTRVGVEDVGTFDAAAATPGLYEFRYRAL